MSEHTMRRCQTHRVCDHFKRKDSGTWRCSKCASDSVTRRRRKVKRLAVEYLGGKCNRCDYETDCMAVYEFHHPDANKEFGISAKGQTRGWESFKVELDKCELLCANCHREEHHN